MSDLVERLRARNSDGIRTVVQPDALVEEAAAEIARLRATVTALVEAAGPFVRVMPVGGSLIHNGVYSIQLEARDNERLGSDHFRALSRAVEAANE